MITFILCFSLFDVKLVTEFKMLTVFVALILKSVKLRNKASLLLEYSV